MDDGGHVQPRTIIFIGCEGKSERAFVRVLARLCIESRRVTHSPAVSHSP